MRSERTEAAKAKLRASTERGLPMGAPNPDAHLLLVVEALMDVLSANQAEALALVLDARLP